MNLPFVRPRYAWAVKLPCMRFVLYGTSSFSYWLSAPCRPSSKSAVGTNALKRCVPTARTVAYLEKIFPQIPQPYHALVPDHRKSTVPQAVTHVSIYPYREKPFVRIADGVYASCTELCFVQLALVLPLHELLKAGDALSRIAVRYHMPLADLIRKNPQIKNISKIYPGQRIRLN